MDAATLQAYEEHAVDWIAHRSPQAIEDGRLAAFARRLRRGARVADLGSGPGWYAAQLDACGFRVVALDAAPTMLAEVARRAPRVARLRADLAALPFVERTFDGVWAINCYPHVPRQNLPLALANLHAVLRPGAIVELTLANLTHIEATEAELLRGEGERRFADDPLRGRLFSLHTALRVRALLSGAGFAALRVAPLNNPFWLQVRARRARSLPDLVGPDLRLLICGLNPSLYSADVGIPFARPGNRFWPAARAAGLVERERDPRDAFRRGIGMTDLVKRATSTAGALRQNEYAVGLRRVEALVRLYQPGAICFVGLDGWRQVADRTAQPGWIPGGLGGRPAYLMPSTSGRNARVPLRALVEHLQRAAGGQTSGRRQDGQRIPSRQSSMCPRAGRV